MSQGKITEKQKEILEFIKEREELLRIQLKKTLIISDEEIN